MKLTSSFSRVVTDKTSSRTLQVMEDLEDRAMNLTSSFSHVQAASEMNPEGQQDPDEAADDIQRFMPERLWTPEQKKTVEDWQQRKKEAELAKQQKQQEEELKNQVTLESPIRAIWGVSDHWGGKHQMNWSTSYILNQLDVRNVGQLIKTSYEKIKKAAWDYIAQSFGYTEPLYNPLPPHGWDEMSNSEKRVAIHDRSLHEVRSMVYDLQSCLKRVVRHPYGGADTQLAPLPQPVINWINYISEEEQHDDEMKQKDQRSETALKEQDERWAQEAKKKDADAQLIAAALWKARKQLPYWEDSTKEDALEMARNFLQAEPHERGQYSKAIRDIIQNTLKKRIPTKSYYMEPDEAAQFVKTALDVDLKIAKPEEVVEIFNKTMGITNSSNPDHPDWSDEGVNPGLGAGILGPAGGLKMEASGEIHGRLQKAKELDDDAMIRKIYYALDAQNRKFFFKE